MSDSRKKAIADEAIDIVERYLGVYRIPTLMEEVIPQFTEIAAMSEGPIALRLRRISALSFEPYSGLPAKMLEPGAGFRLSLAAKFPKKVRDSRPCETVGLLCREAHAYWQLVDYGQTNQISIALIL